jgi:perosamine synthetase
MEIFSNKFKYINMNKYENIIDFIKSKYPEKKVVNLHEPLFIGNELTYIKDAIDSTFVSSVGKFVDKFEQMICDYTGAKFAIATVNGTAALHMSLLIAGVESGNLVITQPLSFVATCNAISYIGAQPIFVDVDMETMGMCPISLEAFLKSKTVLKENKCFFKETNQLISACLPMHSFGHPCKIEEIKEICLKFNIVLVEDAAESLGSKINNVHTGTIGKIGAYSFNGNKTITCGGGGVIVTNDEKFAKLAKHLTTTAKVSHKWEYVHDQVGYNYRLPNLNAALACAQMEMLEKYIENKRDLAQSYIHFFNNNYDTIFKQEPLNTRSNYWLNTVLFANSIQRDEFLNYASCNNINARPAWKLMTNLNMYKNCSKMEIANSLNIEERAVNLPSSVRL